MHLIFDSDKCTGCMACYMACLDQRDVRPMEGERPLLRVEQEETHGVLRFRLVRCTGCGACADVCPTGCLSRKETGDIIAEEARCIGCRACETACPEQVISFDANTGTVRKCDGCRGRVSAGMLPACVPTCPTGALSWEEL